MAEVFEILDNVLYSKNCPLGINDVYEEEFFEKNPAATGDENELEDNRPPSIHEMEYEDQLKWAYKVLKANNAKPKHGDVIWIGGESYRNQGIHFWDAKNQKIIPMATKIADYGHVPKRFAVGKGEGEFRSTHWDGISYYNNLEPYWSSKKKAWYYASECVYQSGSETDSE
jgi:hypothetical protein